MNIMKMMQAASKVKQQMQEMQERIQQIEIEGEAAGGAVKCRVNGRFELKGIKIDPSFVKPEETELLEDMVMVAINDARAKVEKIVGDETQKIMADAGLPAGAGLPF